MSVALRDKIQKMTVTLLIVLSMVMGQCMYADAASVDTVKVRSASLDGQIITRNGMVRVYLSSLGNPSRLDITVKGSYRMNPGNVELPNGAKLTVSFSSSTGSLTVKYNGQTYQAGKRFSLFRRADNDSNGILIDQSRDSGNPYPGDLSLEAVSNGSGYTLYPIAHVYIEKYLYGVLPYEMGNSSGKEALKAQAVAARTYTVRMMKSRASSRYDVKDTTSDQVYRGTPSGNGNCVAAVDATKGIVLMYGSDYITTYYSASNGGQTEIARTGSSYPYMKIKDDPFDYDNPNSAVKKKTVYRDLSKSSNPSGLISLLKSKVVSALQRLGYPANAENTTLNQLTDVAPHTPMYSSPSRLFTQMDFSLTAATRNDAGEKKTVSVTVTCSIFGELEGLLGMSHQSASNELWSVEKTEGAFVLQSRRYGHGMGMSQRGAMYMATLGYTYDQILGFYYEGCKRVAHAFTHTILTSESGNVDITVDKPVDSESGDLPEMEVTAQQAVVATESGSLNLRKQPDLNSSVLTTIPQGASIDITARGDMWCAARYNGKSGYVMTRYLKFTEQDKVELPSEPEAGSKLKARVTTESGSLNLRTSPNIGSRILERIPQYTVLNVLERGDNWSVVEYAGIQGYVMTKFLTFEAVEDLPSSDEKENDQPEDVPSADKGQTAYVYTASGSLNMRREPSLTGAFITSIPRLAEVEVITYGDMWCAVRYRGYKGYSMTRFLRFDEQQPETETTDSTEETAMWVATQSGSLNLRSAASLQAGVIATIPQHARVAVLKYDDEWSYIRYQGNHGYVMSSFLSKQQTETEKPYAPTQTQPEQPPQPDDKYITTGGITLDITLELPVSAAWATTKEDTALYPMCAEDAGYLITVPAGTEVEVLLVGELWCRVAYQEEQGYCWTNQLNVRYE